MFYARELLRIKPKKGGGFIPFVFNRAQRYIDQRLDAQVATKGRARALILKMRQGGASTYVAGRFFRKLHVVKGTKCYILSHERDSSDHLFSMPKGFWDQLPEDMRPHVGRSTMHKLIFSRMNSEYQVGTAGAKETGRSQTIQLFHGSEVAHWPNAQDHLSGVLQAVPGEAGTEIILESTANGVGGAFYDLWQQAEKGEGEFICIFVPWFWQEDYEEPVPRGWTAENEEAEYAALHDLTPQQSYWMHLKNLGLGGQPGVVFWKFRQEYPSTAEEAFQAGGLAGLIKPAVVVQARRRKLGLDDGMPLVIGVDVARNIVGGDETVIMSRQGRVAGRQYFVKMRTDDTMVIAAKVGRILADDPLVRMAFVDIGGVGAGVYDRLRELGHGARVTGVMFGEQAHDPTKYRNRRAEMWWELMEWLNLVGGVQIPDEDALHRQLCAPQYREDSQGRKILEGKPEIKKRLLFSPDEADALALTFADKVVEPTSALRRFAHRPKPQGISWMAY